jgi:hypothetical protein
VFETYRFDNLETDESRHLDGWSYFWAAVGGPVYVLLKGFVVAAGVMLMATAGLVSFDSLMVWIVASVAIPLAALVAQAVIAIQLVRAGYIRQGWREGY